MLTLITGNPGNGKSLYTVTAVEKQRLAEGREVYYDGIPELKYAWKPLPVIMEIVAGKRGEEGKNIPRIDWSRVPDGAIIVVDECWRLYPVRGPGQPVPSSVELLATHRHRGHDLYLATQGKGQVDTFVRALVGKHIHMDRKFGMEYAMRYEWERVADPTNKADLTIAQNSRWMFPKEVYGDYKSAVEHTHKRNLPWKKLITFGAALAVAVGGIYATFHLLTPKAKQTAAVDSSGRVQGTTTGTNPNDYWVKDRRVRVAGIPASAPLYDPLQKVKTQPRPEGCMQMVVGNSIRCECTGPNRSALAMTQAECLDLVKHGWFDETRQYEDVRQKNIDLLNRSSGEGGQLTASAPKG